MGWRWPLAVAGRPAGEYAGWLQLWNWVPFIALIAVYLFLLFPDGRLPGPRWRAVSWMAGGFAVIAVAGLSFTGSASPRRRSSSHLAWPVSRFAPFARLCPVPCAVDQLLVPASVTSPAQLVGESVGVLVGSSEDYELLGYLALEHLTGKVKVVPFADENAAGAAALSGAIDSAYVYGSPATALAAKGYHSLVNAEQIAKLGVPGLDVIAVATSVIKSNPALVQDYVCAELQGSRDMTGRQAAKYLAGSSAAQGVPGNQIVAATKGYPFILPDQQLYWLGSTNNDTGSRMVSAYLQTGKFLVSQGRLTTAPTAAQIAAHVDITFIKKALAGGCPS